MMRNLFLFFAKNWKIYLTIIRLLLLLLLYDISIDDHQMMIFTGVKAMKEMKIFP